jgi:hypothetical protein
MQPMRSCVMEWRGFPFFFPCGWVGWWGLRGGLFPSCVWCGEWTVHFPLGQRTFHARFYFLGRGAAGGVKAISFQVSDMFPKMFPLAPHFYPVCFGKCCPSFTYIYLSQREGALNFWIEPSILGTFHSFIFFEWWANQIGLLKSSPPPKLNLGCA